MEPISLGQTIIDIMQNGNKEENWAELLDHPKQEFRAWAVSMLKSPEIVANVVQDTSETLYIRTLAMMRLKVYHMQEIYEQLSEQDGLRKQPLEWYVKKKRQLRRPKLRTQNKNKLNMTL